jgi:hypothetical protein
VRERADFLSAWWVDLKLEKRFTQAAKGRRPLVWRSVGEWKLVRHFMLLVVSSSPISEKRSREEDACVCAYHVGEWAPPLSP